MAVERHCFLTPQELQKCRDAFIFFDKDRSGKIDVWELQVTLESLGQDLAEEELEKMMNEVHVDKSGSIG